MMVSIASFLSALVVFDSFICVSTLCKPVERQTNCSVFNVCEECLNRYDLIPPPTDEYCHDFPVPLCSRRTITFSGTVCYGGSRIRTTFFHGEHENPRFEARLPNDFERYQANDLYGVWGIEQWFTYPMILQPGQQIHMAFIMHGHNVIEEQMNGEKVGDYVPRHGINLTDITKVCARGCFTISKIVFGRV